MNHVNGVISSSQRFWTTMILRWHWFGPEWHTNHSSMHSSDTDCNIDFEVTMELCNINLLPIPRGVNKQVFSPLPLSFFFFYLYCISCFYVRVKFCTTCLPPRDVTVKFCTTYHREKRSQKTSKVESAFGLLLPFSFLFYLVWWKMRRNEKRQR